jgi:hypothetical protein
MSEEPDPIVRWAEEKTGFAPLEPEEGDEYHWQLRKARLPGCQATGGAL